VIGFFMNTLVMRTDLSAIPTSSRCSSGVRQVTLEAYAHQDLPLRNWWKPYSRNEI